MDRVTMALWCLEVPDSVFFSVRGQLPDGGSRFCSRFLLFSSHFYSCFFLILVVDSVIQWGMLRRGNAFSVRGLLLSDGWTDTDGNGRIPVFALFICKLFLHYPCGDLSVV